MDGVTINENSIVAAGSLVTKGTNVPRNSLIIGRPAIVKRQVTQQEIEHIQQNTRKYIKVKEAHQHLSNG